MNASKLPTTQSFPSRDQIQDDVVEILLAMANQARFAFFDLKRDTDAVLWSLLTGRPDELSAGLADPGLSPADLRLEWADAAHTTLGSTMMQLYDYGALGLLDVSAESLDTDEGAAAWVSRLLYDLQRSQFLLEWNEATGGRTSRSVERCLLIAETANARVLLEGGNEGFYPGDCTAGRITFRQLALLSGMTEASLRTIASRPGGGLKTERQGNNSYIEAAEVKVWLKARNRYAPIRRVSNAGAVPLTDRHWPSADEFIAAVDDRLSYLVDELGREVLTQRLQDSPWREPQQSPSGLHVIDLTTQQLMDAELMERLAKALELPEQLFVLRAAEAVHTEALRRIERGIQGAKQ